MEEKITYWAAISLSWLALLLLVFNIALVGGNHKTQDEVVSRQAQINRGATLNQMNNNLVQALAEIATTKNNDAIRGLLAAQGITVKIAAPKAATAPTVDEKKKQKGE